MMIDVLCYSGYKIDERPIRFRLGAREYEVKGLLDQWYGPNEIFFKILADDGNIYILRRNSARPEGEWSLEAFRSTRSDR